MNYYVIIGISFLFGIIFGSFGNVLIHRIPRDIPIGFLKKVRSECTSCKKVIPFYLNIPLFSYLYLKGRCKNCGKKYSSRYFWVELFSGILFAVVVAISLDSPLRDFDPFTFYLTLARDLYFTFTLLVLIYIDIDFRIIPDRFSLGNWAIALSTAYWITYPNFWHAIIGGLIGFGLFFSIAWIFEKVRGIEGLGYGDVKMMGWLGTWLGAAAIPPIILIGSVSGLVAGLIAMKTSKDGFQTAIPFGPFLAMGAFIAWILSKYQTAL